MRGETSGSLFSDVNVGERIPARQPLRKIRRVVNDALASMDAEFERVQQEANSATQPRGRLIALFRLN